MKKFFLLIAIAVGSFVSAQEQTLPVLPQKYPSVLEKKYTFPSYDVLRKAAPSVPNINLMDLYTGQDQSIPAIQLQTLANGNKLAVLPPGSMPCVVPDMSIFHMPNAGINMQLDPTAPGAIPNASAKKP